MSEKERKLEKMADDLELNEEEKAVLRESMIRIGEKFDFSGMIIITVKDLDESYGGVQIIEMSRTEKYKKLVTWVIHSINEVLDKVELKLKLN